MADILIMSDWQYKQLGTELNPFSFLILNGFATICQNAKKKFFSIIHIKAGFDL